MMSVAQSAFVKANCKNRRRPRSIQGEGHAV
jgi:hypothetical protein